MALVKCLECGKTISEVAAACPHCGHPAVKGKKQWNSFERIGCSVIIIIGIIAFVANALLAPTGDGSFARMGKAESALRARLRDPSSYEQIDSKTYDLDGGGHQLVIHYRAKNGFGGYADSYATFNFDAKENLKP